MNPDPVGERRAEEREREREAENAARPADVRLQPRDHAVDEPPPDRQEEHREPERQADRPARAEPVASGNGPHHPEDHAEDDPPGEVVDDRRRDDRDADVASVDVEVHQRLRDDRQRRDRERRGEEEREDRRVGVRLSSERLRHEPTRREPERERERHPGHTDDHRGLPLLPHAREVHLHARHEQEEDDGDGRQRVERERVGPLSGKEERLGRRRQVPEHRRAEHDPRDDLAEHGRLPEVPRRLTTDPGHRKQRPEGEEHDDDLVLGELCHSEVPSAECGVPSRRVLVTLSTPHSALSTTPSAPVS